jgi:bifunctional N-acetylglucosamine-1-phosphate-uridyltransferase/glucosamine-1-phosphate-acetyltransferase GlmU-like protein
MSCNVLLLAAGRGRVIDSGDSYPQCLTELDGVTLIEKIVDTTRSIKGARYFSAILEKDARRLHLDKLMQRLIPNVTVVRIPEETKGSACTGLLAAVQMPQKEPLLIISANELVDLDLNIALLDFQSRSLDGGTLIFRSLHPRYSYVRLGETQLVEETAAQRPISQHATAGIYWFARTSDFVTAAKNLIRKDSPVNGNFFVAPTFNELILKNKRVGVYFIPKGAYMPLKTEQQIQRYELSGT